MSNITIKDIKQALVEFDRIGDEGQKEIALRESGITRRKVYGVIAQGLVAEKQEWGIDERGKSVVVGSGPDYQRRERCALLAVKLFGDMVEKSESVSEVTIRQEEKDAIHRAVRDAVARGRLNGN